MMIPANLRILLVSDETSENVPLMDLIRESVGEKGLARCVAALPDRAGLLSERFSLIVFDLECCSDHAWEQVEGLRQRSPELPFVVVVRDWDWEVAKRAIGLGAQDCLLLPDLTAEFLRRAACLATERHCVAQAVQLRCGFLDSLVSNLPGFAYRCKNDRQWTPLYMSSGCYDLTGYKPDEFVVGGKTFGDIIHPDDYPVVSEEVNGAVAEGRAFRATYRIITAHGKTRWVWEQGQAVLSENGEVAHLQGFLTDITAQKRNEEAILRSSQRSALHFQKMELAAVEWDVEMRVVDWNPAAERLFGYKREEVLGQFGYAFLVPEPLRDQIGQVWRQTIGELQTTHSINENQTRDGSPLVVEWFNTPLVDASGTLIGVTSLARDVTKEREGSLRVELLSTAVEQAGDWVMITDHQARIQYVNASFEGTSGYSRREIIGRTPAFLQGGTHPDIFYDELWERISSGRTWKGTFHNRAKDGSLIVMQSTISPLRDEAGAIKHFVMIGRNITDQVHLEEELRQVQKLKAVGQLGRGVAHEFNNLLTVIAGCSELAAMDLAEGSACRAEIEEIRRATEEAATLTRRLLAFSYQPACESIPVQLDSLVVDTQRTLSRLIGENIELVSQHGNNVGAVLADPGQIEQLLINLTVNARDAMPQGGKLLLETSNWEVRESSAECGLGLPPGQYVRLSIRDSGTGIPAAIQGRVFDPLFTTKQGRMATGLGLTTVERIVRQLSGRILIESEVERGTTFHVFIPRHSTGDDGETGEESLRGDLRGEECLLLAEDDDALRAVAHRGLQRMGYEIHPARNGAEALRLAVELGTRLDLAIMDLILPDTSGAELAQEIRERAPKAGMLFISGYSGEIVRSHGVESPGFRFLQKPFTPVRLAEKVREILGPGKLRSRMTEESGQFR